MARVYDYDRMDSAKIFSLCMALHTRLDTLWQRLIYSHAAIVGVMVFFSAAADHYLVPRVLVFLIYSINLGVSMSALNESYKGMQAALADIRASEKHERLEHFEAWLRGLDYEAHPVRRVMLFAVAWVLVGYLLFVRFMPAWAWPM